MTTWIVKEEEIEGFLEDWKQGILKALKDKNRALVASNSIHGTFNAPSKRIKHYRTAGFAFNPDIFKKKEDVSPFSKSAPFAFFFVPKESVNFTEEQESDV